MINASEIYENIGNIEDKCSELISEINQHLSVKEINIIKESTKQIEIQGRPHNQERGGSKQTNDTKPKAQSNEEKCADFMFLDCHQTIVSVSCNHEKNFNSRNIVQTVKEIYLDREICSKITKINQFLDEKSIFKVPEKILYPEHGECGVHAVSTKKRLDVQHLHHISIKPPLIKQVAFSLNLQADKKNAEQLRNVATFECVHNSPSSRLNIGNEIVDEGVAEAEYCSRFSNETRNFDEYKEDESKSDRNRRVILNENEDEHIPEAQTNLNENLIGDNLRSFLFGNLKNEKIPELKILNSTAVSKKAKKIVVKKKGNRKNVKFKIGESISDCTANEYSKPQLNYNILNEGNNKINEDLVSKKFSEVNHNCLLDSYFHTYSAGINESNTNEEVEKTNVGIQKDITTFSVSPHVLINAGEKEFTQSVPTLATRTSKSNRIQDTIMQDEKHRCINNAVKSESKEEKIILDPEKESIRNPEYSDKTDADLRNNKFILHQRENTKQFDVRMKEKVQQQTPDVFMMPLTTNNENLLSASAVFKNENKYGNISKSKLKNFTDHEKHVKMLLDIINGNNFSRDPEKSEKLFKDILLVPTSNVSSSLVKGPPSPPCLSKKIEIQLKEIQPNTDDVNKRKVVGDAGISLSSKLTVKNEKCFNLSTPKLSFTKISNLLFENNALAVATSSKSSSLVKEPPSPPRHGKKIEIQLNEIQPSTNDVNKMKLVGDAGISLSSKRTVNNKKYLNVSSPELSSDSLLEDNALAVTTSSKSSSLVKRSPLSSNSFYKIENKLNEIQTDMVDTNKTKSVGDSGISPSSNRVTPKLSSTTSDSSNTPSTCSLSPGELKEPKHLSPGEIIIVDKTVRNFHDSFLSSSSSNVPSEGEIIIAVQDEQTRKPHAELK